MSDDKKNQPPIEKQDQQKDYAENTERKDHGRVDREAIIEKMQRPSPWPSPPDESDNESSE